MTVLTNAVAAGIPGRLAPYRHTPRIDIARFRGLTSDVLFALEYGPDGEGGDTDAPQEYIEQLLVILADWRQRLLDGTRSDAGTYQAALNTTREAWLQYSFRWDGGPDLPYPFDLATTVPNPVVVQDGHRVPDCDGWCQRGDMCSTPVTEQALPGGGRIITELYADEGQPVTAVVFTDDLAAHAALLRTTDPAQLEALADRFHALGNDLIHAAHVLTETQKREAE
ncbi:hypothetical protein ACI3K5_03900 [Streptomyces sp. MPA0124]|uniref:hypothetical protein n=1 Tax=Streptomyces sp. MPA0124 TaxID=3378069 RepID=UPI003854B154